MEHGLGKASVSKAEVTCLCGAKFDGFGDRGAANKFKAHMESFGMPCDLQEVIATASAEPGPSILKRIFCSHSSCFWRTITESDGTRVTMGGCTRCGKWVAPPREHYNGLEFLQAKADGLYEAANLIESFAKDGADADLAPHEISKWLRDRAESIRTTN